MKRLQGRAALLCKDDVDTDQIIPARYLTTVTRQGLGQGLFFALRQEPGFELPSVPILLAGRNFGCGSSREHAVWALTDFGFQAVVAVSFADIFYNNSLKNGLLPVALPESVVQHLQVLVADSPLTELQIDLPAQEIRWPGGSAPFEIEPYRKLCLMEGLDDLGYLVSLQAEIGAFERTAANSA